MISTWLKSILVKLEHPLKHARGIVVRRGFKTIEDMDKELQLLNAYSPIVVTFVQSISTLVKLEQPLNALFDIDVILFNPVTLYSDVSS